MEARVDTKVAEVTVSEDRAHVVRRGEARLGAGVTTLTIPGVAPVLVDKTLKVTLDDGVTVGEVRVVRRRLHLESERPPDVAALDAEIDAKELAVKELARRRVRFELELGDLDALLAQSIADASTDASWGRLDAAATRARLRAVEAEEKKKRAEYVAFVDEQRRHAEDLTRLRARRDSHGQAATKESAEVVVVVEAAAARTCNVTLDYIVPGACWRPQHTARLVAGKLRFQADGCVWQSTGETWENAAILLSTERPSLGREPPRLTDDRIAAQRKQEVIVVEWREQEVQTAGLGGGGAAAAQTVPGIDDGGEARVLRGTAKATIPSDGRPHRVPLFSFETEGASELVMMPALAPVALMKSTQVNAAKQPILAGPVDLVLESGIVGRTQILFVAPGEKFELGWGPDPGVRARRAVEEVDEEPGALSSWLSRAHRVTVHLSNLDASPRTIALTEAVPVSEIEKVKIIVDTKETTEAKKPDADGFVRWNVHLEGRGRAKVELRYVVKRHKEVSGV